MPLIAPEDRHAIEDLYAEYVWALDTGDVPAFLALFTPDGVFGDTAGNIYKARTPSAPMCARSPHRRRFADASTSSVISATARAAPKSV